MRAWVASVGIAVIFVVGLAVAKQPKPVILHLGPIVPTPAPSPEKADRIRMITSFTMQNKPVGDSVISFEATDFADGDKPEKRIIAIQLYSLAELKKPAARAVRDRILLRIRELERDLLELAEIVGPPRERDALSDQGGQEKSY